MIFVRRIDNSSLSIFSLQAEMAQCINLGVEPADIIFSHPVKMVSHMNFAKKMGVDLSVFDSAEELRKIAIHFPDCR